MHKRVAYFGTPVALALAVMTIAGFGAFQSEVKLEPTGVNAMLIGLGYETKALSNEPGKEKYEIVITRSGLDVPIAAEVSGSRNYIWLTTFLGEAPKSEAASGAKMRALLNQNFKIQPCHFYITDAGNLMLGMAVENRNVTPAILRRVMEKVADDVSKSQELWANGGKQ